MESHPCSTHRFGCQACLSSGRVSPASRVSGPATNPNAVKDIPLADGVSPRNQVACPLVAAHSRSTPASLGRRWLDAAASPCFQARLVYEQRTEALIGPNWQYSCTIAVIVAASPRVEYARNVPNHPPSSMQQCNGSGNVRVRVSRYVPTCLVYTRLLGWPGYCQARVTKRRTKLLDKNNNASLFLAVPAGCRRPCDNNSRG